MGNTTVPLISIVRHHLVLFVVEIYKNFTRFNLACTKKYSILDFSFRFAQ